MPSIGKDLSIIRDHNGYSLQDIQNLTKIPLHTLQSIEKGTIFEEDQEIKTYIRSFVRSYAKAVKIDSDLIVKALDQQETGNYNHLLLQQYPELSHHLPSTLKEDSKDLTSETEQDPGETSGADLQDETQKSESSEESKKPGSAKTDESQLTSKKSASKKSSVKSQSNTDRSSVNKVDWAGMGKKIKKEEKKTPVWLITILILLLVSAAVAYFVYQGEYLNTEADIQSAPEEMVEEQEGLALDITTAEPEEDVVAEPEAALADTLFITIYAAYNRLDPVRVWSDLKPRNDPYWIEQGFAMNFEFSDTIRINGPFDQMLLFFNGHRIDNFMADFFNDDENAVELTRDLFTSDPEWATQIELDLPENTPEPESIDNRPTF